MAVTWYFFKDYRVYRAAADVEAARVQAVRAHNIARCQVDLAQAGIDIYNPPEDMDSGKSLCYIIVKSDANARANRDSEH
jgi:formylmethanofuran:tetrahydromethanopterin formyltransferase